MSDRTDDDEIDRLDRNEWAKEYRHALAQLKAAMSPESKAWWEAVAGKLRERYKQFDGEDPLYELWL